MRYLRDVPDIHNHLTDLSHNDARFSQYGIDVNVIPWEVYPEGFSGLVRITLGQQISAKVADTLWLRVCEACGGVENVSAKQFLKFDDDTMKGMGFSRQKTRYVRQLAQNIESGAFDVKLLSGDDDTVFKAIIGQLGYGPWSAHMYLLFCLARPNVLPSGDLAVDLALKHLFQLDEKPDYKAAKELCAPWHGQWTALTLILWQIYVDHM